MFISYSVPQSIDNNRNFNQGEISNMLDSVKNKIQRNALISILTFIVNSTKGEAGYALVPKAEVEKLHKHEPTFVMIDTSTPPNAEGMVKVKATQIAIDALSNAASTEAPAAAATKEVKETMNYEIGTISELPAILRGGHKAESYPFEKLAAPADGKYSFFFVPATDAKPNPAKTLASTVASATKRYKSERVFTVRKVTVDGKVTGAQVIRTK